MKKTRLLLVSFLLVMILPLIGSWLKWGGMPPGYGLFPAQKVVEDPGFNSTVFTICCVIAGIILLFLMFPSIFGFKKPPKTMKEKKDEVSFPKWFWPGVIIMAVSWFFMWGRFEIVEPIDHYTFVPLWWGFILALDGWVYKRNGGVSLISKRPNTMKLLAVTSAFSWFFFEYLNFFVLENWYYPNNEVFTNFGNISWQLLSYTTVLPALFEWYYLLKTSKFFKERYSYGPKISGSKPIFYLCLIVGLSLTCLMAYYPFQLFWMLWVSLIPILVPAMALSGKWSPFSAISKNGNWSFVILIALATLLNGFFWEFWNFGSEWFHDYMPTNPNYWKYSVPYLDKYHFFSEMPVLGYFGYMFFGNVCWLLWLTLAYILGFNPSIDSDDESQINFN
jgi:hypothetical protein